MDINLSIPVTVFDYKESENPLYSIAKLKIFYVGMTPDKRLFTKEFSDNLLKTLPYVPVVGFYDKEEEDFKGHNKNQYIYGVVPESTEVNYEEQDDKEYAICDVILYTGRKDETGEIAQKIVGQPHSLELNPDDVTYEVHKNGEGKIEAIEFKTGSLLGLSVLGDEQQPAFTGSEFFEAQKDLSDIIKGFNTEWEKHEESKKRGNEEMEFDLFKVTNVFIEKTYSEKMKEMARSLSSQYNYFYINDLFEEYVIVTIFNEETYEANTFRISYSSEEDNIVFGDKVQVYPRYLTLEEIAKWEETMNNEEENDEDFEDNSSEPGAEEENDFEEGENKEEEEETNEEEFEENEEEEESEEEFEDESSVDNKEGETDEQELEENDEFEEEQQEEEQQGENEEEFGSKSLDSGEREELEALRRERKLMLIASFEGDLTKDFIKEVINTVDNSSYEELETKLSKEFTRIKKEQEQEEFEKQNTKVMSPLLMSVTKKTQDRNSLVKSLVERYKD